MVSKIRTELEKSSLEESISIEETIALSIKPGFSYIMLSKQIEEHVQEMKSLFIDFLKSKNLVEIFCTSPEKLLSQLPLIQSTRPADPPDSFEVYLLCNPPNKEANTEDILLDLLQNWLIPGKKAQILSFNHFYFQCDYFPQTTFLFSEVKILIENGREQLAVQVNLPSVIQKIISSIQDIRFYNYLRSTRQITFDQKTSSVYQDLATLLRRIPKYFDANLFSEMSRFFSLVPQEFMEPRSSRLLSRIIATHYLMRTNLLRAIGLYPDKRHVFVRYVRSDLTFVFGSKTVLGIICGVSFLDKHECFEESHILQAVQVLIPEAQIVKGSFYAFQGFQEPFRTLYLELEKSDGSFFSKEELQQLKLELQDEMQKRIETLVPSIFMIRNEEEVMRNVLILSQELKYVSDIPQVMISLDRQSSTEIFFTLVVVRIHKHDLLPIQKSFEKISTPVRFSPDRVQNVGFVRKNYPKEANVFHLSIFKDSSLLRADNSVNFYVARQRVALLLEEAIGPFRDYNGGMILKQGEIFCQFKEAFQSIAPKDQEFLENFFFSLNPIETQATLSLSIIESLFNLYLEAMKVTLSQNNHYFLKIKEDQDTIYTIIRTEDAFFKEALSNILKEQQFSHKSIIYSLVDYQNSFYAGLIFQTNEAKKRQQFITFIHEIIQDWKHRLNSTQALKLSFFALPTSLDPRLGGDEISYVILKMLFEGLSRIGKDGKPALAIADSVEISEEQTKYLFKLKKCYWSNQTEVTSYDFEYTWKKILSPQFSTPFAYFFYPIKNAKLAKEGKCSIDEVGVRALDDYLLEVTLEHPTPEFLELTAHTLYSPVNHKIDKMHPNWSILSPELFVCNGPFMLKKITSSIRYELGKNSSYWDKDAVKLEQIIISKENGHIANEMYQKKEIDWLGKPLRVWEPFFAEDKEAKITSFPVGIYWCLLNVERFPFNNLKIRQAFSYAIDRYALAKLMSNDDLPASTLLPLSQTLNHDPQKASGNFEKAKKLLKQGLKELGLDKSQFPILTLIHPNITSREKASQLITEQWEKVLGIPCRTEGYDFSVFFSKLTSNEFSLATLYWKSWIDDPIYTLGIFQDRNHSVNFPRWHHPRYSYLIEKARHCKDMERLNILAEAERILIEDNPVIPIFYEKERHIKRHDLKNVYYSQTTGFVDFKCAFKEKNQF